MRVLALFTAILASALSIGSAAGQEANDAGAALLNPLAAIDPTKLDGFLERPLFSSTRRPPPAAPSETPTKSAAAPPATAPAVRLVGVIHTPKESIAQLVQDGDGERLSVRVGDYLDDWTVAAIDSSTVTLKLGEQEARFDIFRSPPSGAVPAKTDASDTTTRRRNFSKQDFESFFGSTKL